MGDLIKRQDAIDAIDKIFPADPMKNEYTQGITCGAALATEYIKQLPPAQQWIPCSERLPEEEGDYLLFGKVVDDDEEEYQFIGNYDSGCEQFGIWQEQFDRITLGCLGSEFVEYASVIAWMPLPEAYKALDQERDCEHCVHHTDKGCSSLDCEFERRQ